VNEPTTARLLAHIEATLTNHEGMESIRIGLEDPTRMSKAAFAALLSLTYDHATRKQFGMPSVQITNEDRYEIRRIMRESNMMVINGPGIVRRQTEEDRQRIAIARQHEADRAARLAAAPASDNVKKKKKNKNKPQNENQGQPNKSPKPTPPPTPPNPHQQLIDSVPKNLRSTAELLIKPNLPTEIVDDIAQGIIHPESMSPAVRQRLASVKIVPANMGDTITGAVIKNLLKAAQHGGSHVEADTPAEVEQAAAPVASGTPFEPDEIARALGLYKPEKLPPVDQTPQPE
jgi:hypothetical protein